MTTLQTLECLVDIVKHLVDLIYDQARLIDENETIDTYTKNRLNYRRQEIVDKMNHVLGKEEH